MLQSSMNIIVRGEQYAKDKHKGMIKKDGMTSHVSHLEEVVSRLKGIGVSDENVLCTGWLHDTLEDTEATFDEIYERFGQKIAVLVSSLTKDENLSKKEKELQYIKQLKDAPFEAKLVKLCDLSANLKAINDSNLSKTKKKRTINKLLHYLRVIINEISEHKSDYPRVSSLIDGINQISKEYSQKPIVI